ncbi:SDR family oxidoreductase [Amycolatopsis sp. NPDC049253]|uniref:SDR family NAD(P)-dependent oxidoreductase n=1 Tax=Amycolatopsis sp. NPDC049253 TaxID=3155274 RepID=UPI003421D725
MSDQPAVLVTGASGGIGRCVVADLARRGHRVIAAIAAGEAADEASPAVASFGVDVTDTRSVTDLFASVGEVTDRLDGLVVAAGVLEDVPFRELGEDGWRRTLSVNLDGAYRTVAGALPLLDRSPSAAIVLLTSQLAYSGGPNAVAYSASKAGLLGFARALARDLGPAIRVNTVAPGPINTPMTAAFADVPGWVEQKTSRQVMRRFGEPGEVSSAIAYLLSEEASFFTGQTLSPNGGGVML